MKIYAYAKINWSLQITGKREDGYHYMDMVMQQIDLHDTLHVTAHPDLLLLPEKDTKLPPNQDNLIMKAAAALRKAANISEGACIRYKKRIPIGAGLGGGSADAAAVLHALNHLWRINFGMETLCRIGASLGADIPYCLTGGLCRVQGIGDVLCLLPDVRSYWMVVIQPCRGLSTKEVFSAYRPENSSSTASSNDVISALSASNFRQMNKCCQNDLQQTAEALRPQISKAIYEMKNAHAKHVMMTGSGSAVYGVFRDSKSAMHAHLRLKKNHPLCYLTHTIPRTGPICAL